VSGCGSGSGSLAAPAVSNTSRATISVASDAYGNQCASPFSTFLNPLDLLWSFIQAILMALAILLIHTYFGFFASGGPSGVGVGTGDAVRTSLVVVVSVTLLVSL
jgi:ABC-type transporter Mla maintaining outer membrane lipid asymmetry permease subunit MlaE